VKPFGPNTSIESGPCNTTTYAASPAASFSFTLFCRIFTRRTFAKIVAECVGHFNVAVPAPAVPQTLVLAAFVVGRLRDFNVSQVRIR
jgi:hypothetical protein